MQLIPTVQAVDPKMFAIRRHWERGEMTEAEAKILVMLAEHRGMLSAIQEDMRIVRGTNGTPSLATRLDRIEVRASVFQRLKMHAITTTIGIVIAVAVGYIIVKPPSPAEVQQLEELKQQNAALKAKVEDLEKTKTATPVVAAPSADTSKPRPRSNRPRPAPPLGPGARNETGDVIANPALRAYSSIKLESMEWRP